MHKHTTTARRIPTAARLTASLAAALAASTAAPALAQQYADQGGGRARDANNGVGSGGINNQVDSGRINGRVNNDLVTGNVSGGREFRGDIDYTAPGAFRGELGSDDLFRFRAQAAFAPPGTPTTSAYNYATTPSNAFNASPIAAGYYVENTFVPAVVNVNNPGNRFALNNRAAFGSVTQTVSQIAQLRGADGQTFTVEASPLLGARTYVTGVNDPYARPTATNNPNAALDPLSPNAPRDDARNSPFNQPARPGIGPDTDDLPEPPRPGDAIDSAVRGQADFLSQRSDQTAFQQRLQQATSPTSVLGEQLRAEQRTRTLNPDGTEATAEQADDGYERLRELIFGATADTAGDEDASRYEDLLTGIASGQSADAETVNNPLADPNQETIDAVEARLAAIRREIYGNPEADPDDPDADPVDLTDPTGGNPNVNTPLERLLDELNYDLPRLETLAAENDSNLNNLLREAEASLANGEYIDAQALYERAAVLAPNDPLPMVGRTHALIGAGMIRSASLQLRTLFEQNPEMIAARYDKSLLPADDQLRRVQNDLDRLVEQPASQNAAGILTAYLGYQLDAPVLVRYGLAVAEAAASADPLVPILRRIWLDEK